MQTRWLRPLRPLRILVYTSFVMLLAGTAGAVPWNFVGARQQAMGGTGVANTSDSTANYWNPANLAFQKGWGVQLPITINGNIENDALGRLSDLLFAYDQLDTTSQAIFQCQPACLGSGLVLGQAQGIANLLGQIATYGTQGENVNVGAALGLAGRYESFGFSAMSLTTGTVYPNTDLANLGLGLAALDLVAAGAGCCQLPANAALGNQVAAVTVGGLNLTNAEGGHLVFLLEQAGLDSSDPRIQQLAIGLVDPAGGLLSANNTGALAAGLSVQEFAFSYAMKLPVPFMRKTKGETRRILDTWVHEKVALSVVPKYMLGVTFIKFFRYDDTNSAGGIVTDLIDIDSSNVSNAFGLDIGLSYRPTSWVQVGMMARNVNSPSFDVQPFVGFLAVPVTSISLDPQVRVGLALIPIENLTLAFDVDATENEIATVPGFTSRLVSLGAEYAVPFGDHVALALRLGAYNNVSGNTTADWAMTGGFGLRFGSFHLDLSAGGSFSDEVVRTGTTSFDTLPTRLNVGLGLSWEKSL